MKMDIVDGQFFASFDVNSCNAPAATPTSLTYNRSTVWLAGVRQEGGQGVETTVTALPVRIKDL